eukprot:XP_001700999.1 predicted protein [Chlamydomonas reinhardtii]
MAGFVGGIAGAVIVGAALGLGGTNVPRTVEGGMKACLIGLPDGRALVRQIHALAQQEASGAYLAGCAAADAVLLTSVLGCSLQSGLIGGSVRVTWFGVCILHCSTYHNCYFFSEPAILSPRATRRELMS